MDFKIVLTLEGGPLPDSNTGPLVVTVDWGEGKDPSDYQDSAVVDLVGNLLDTVRVFVQDRGGRSQNIGAFPATVQ